ncbi:MAG: YHS domain-containing (seleno)protein [Pseudomonadota bacterium]
MQKRLLPFLAVCAAFSSGSAMSQADIDAEYEARKAKLQMAIVDAAGSAMTAIVLPVEALANPIAVSSFSPIVRDPESRLALEGYDPVGYFTESTAMLGDPEFQAEYDGAIFYFANAEHREMFLATPEKFAPAYGGYCTETIAAGALTPASPLHWTVHGDRLYLTRSAAANRAFQERRAQSIDAANQHWSQAELFRNNLNVEAIAKDG